MREILFRGKKTYGGGWIEGCLIQAENFCCILQEEEKANAWDYPYLDGKLGHIDGTVDPVYPETVGQFTGMTDKNGRRIFELDMFHLDDEIIAVVIFHAGCFRLEEYGIRGAFTESGFDECGGGWGIIDCDPIDFYTIGDMEVIGNIHDNPELLGGAKDV